MYSVDPDEVRDQITALENFLDDTDNLSAHDTYMRWGSGRPVSLDRFEAMKALIELHRLSNHYEKVERMSR